jgi:hypothetical protein
MSEAYSRRTVLGTTGRLLSTGLLIGRLEPPTPWLPCPLSFADHPQAIPPRTAAPHPQPNSDPTSAPAQDDTARPAPNSDPTSAPAQDDTARSAPSARPNVIVGQGGVARSALSFDSTSALGQGDTARFARSASTGQSGDARSVRGAPSKAIFEGSGVTASAKASPEPAAAHGSGGAAVPSAAGVSGVAGAVSATGAVQAVPISGVAQQLVPVDRPVIHTRKEWGALPPRRPAEVLPHGPDHIVVHHTDSPNSADMSLAHAFQLSRSIQRFHMNRRGWDDIGQQLTITRGGHVLEGRNRSLPSILGSRLVVGAQTMHQNDHTIGIENEGTYMRAPVAPLLWKSLVRVCGWLCITYGLDPQHAIVGHRDFMPTDCPGDVLYRRLPELRRAVARLIAELR